MAIKKVRVLIVDDSALVREILEKGLSRDPGIEVVGKAGDVFAARDKIIFLKPDVLTLDVEMPKMDGIEFLKRLMPQYPIPVIIVSSMSSEGSRVTLDALAHGAVDFVLKPSLHVGTKLNEMMKELCDKIKGAAGTDLSKWKKIHEKMDHSAKKTRKILEGTTDKVIAIGASTGGTVAITRILEEYPADMPGTVIVQHMPPVFTKMFAQTLHEQTGLDVKEAEDGDRIVRGRVLIAPGGKHMTVRRSGGYYLVNCIDGDKVNGHCPSVDVMFDSVAEHVGSNALGIILTGMGKDGADGMLKMRRSGARTMAQDESSSVVFGMPNEAYKNGGAERLISLDEICNEILLLLKKI